MMAVQMGKPSEVSFRERAQSLYNKNLELENTRRKSTHARIPSDPNVCQQIRENYEAIILEDHSFSEQLEIELALWQLHYRRIEELRGLFSAALTPNVSSDIQNGKGGPAHCDRLARIRSRFKTFLSEATGFYHELMLKIRAKYGLPLAYFSDDPENQVFLSKDGQQSTDIKKGLISCHRCLIYLGDLARYKGLYGDGESKSRDFAAASSYYMQASSLWPTSGNPHHQLAILAAYQGDEFVAIYRYFRSLAVENRFSTARDNLIIAFERNRQSYLQLVGDSKSPKAATPKMTGKGRGRGEVRPLLKDNRSQSTQNKDRAASIPETFKAFCVKFIRVNGILFTRTSLEAFEDVLSMAKSDCMMLLSSGVEEKYHFGSDATECGLTIVRLVAILIFTVHNLNRECDNQSYADILQRSVLLQNAYVATFEFMKLIVERCLQLQDPLSSYLLPGLLVFVEWLACHPDVSNGNEAGEEQSRIRLCFWDSCISFFNKLLYSGFMPNNEGDFSLFNMNKYEEGETANRIALWEDFELRGFLPLHPAQSILDFSRKHLYGNDGIKEKTPRIQRIIAAGKALANVVRVGKQGLYFDPVTKKFIIGAEPQLCSDFAIDNGLEMLRLNETCQQQSPERKTSLGVVEPALQTVDGEDEEEVIVFKPSAAEKQVDEGFPRFTPCKDLGLVANVSTGNMGVHVQYASDPLNRTDLRSGCQLTLRPSTSIASAAMQYLPLVQPNGSDWLLEQQACMVNGPNKFGAMDNGHFMNQKPPQFLPTALSLPLSSAVNLDMVNDFSALVSDAAISFKTDFDPSPRSELEICTVKSQLISPVGSRKNPVSRPIRHVGPPPGFAAATSKLNDDLCSESCFKDNPMMDDYSWLDGYQMSASARSGTECNGSLYSNVGKNNSIVGAISFPFPGKQVSAFKAPAESNTLLQDYQFPDHSKLYEQQQKGNQQPISLPDYQGQSMWGSRFLV